MTPALPGEPTRTTCLVQRLAASLACTLALLVPLGSHAQVGIRAAASSPQGFAAARLPVKTPVEQGVRWRDLKPAQQALLRPLEQDWSRIDGSQKQKWLQVAAGFPNLSTAEQARVQARMADWAKLTPQERGQARLNFQEATQLPAQDRKARWDAYQALSPDQKRQLAERAAPAGLAAADAASRSTPTAASPSRADRIARDAVQTKSNIVPNPALANRPRTVSPTVVRASPGATTTTISKRPTPPSHQQTGLPKIAGTPAFVDKATLLPRRGPQGAAIHAEPAASADPSRRR